MFVATKCWLPHTCYRCARVCRLLWSDIVYRAFLFPIFFFRLVHLLYLHRSYVRTQTHFSCCLISRGSNVWLPWIGELGGIPSDCHFNSYLISGTLGISTSKSQWYLIQIPPGAELKFLGFAENLRYQNKCIDAMSNFNKPSKKIAYKYRPLPRQIINSGAWFESWYDFS